ncbi:unnamed protein product, partial [Polarella glacialis]
MAGSAGMIIRNSDDVSFFPAGATPTGQSSPHAEVFARNPRTQALAAHASAAEGYGLGAHVSRQQPPMASMVQQSPWSRGALDVEDQPLIRGGADVNELNRDPFHENRWRCIFRPERAVETLGPCASLEVTIVKARNLISQELSVALTPTCNPYVKIQLDDTFVSLSRTQRRTTAPEWRYRTSIDITAPTSMIRFQVADSPSQKPERGDAEIGFVEICIADLPYGRQVEGWMELRLQENLQRTSVARYAEHSTMRDDEQDGGKGKRLRNRQQRKRREDKQDALLQGEVKDALSMPGEAGVGRAVPDPSQKSLFSTCVNYLADRSTEMGFNFVPDLYRDEKRYNAGEILIRLRLEPVGSALDKVFGLALKPLEAHDFGTHMKSDTDPDFETQHLWDDVQDVKRHVLEDCVACALNYCSYLLQWRSVMLSLLLAASFVGPIVYSVLHPHVRNFWLFPAVSPAVLTLLLLLAAWRWLRLEMTTGGSNAPLTQEGFERVARWRDSQHMAVFIERVVTDLQGRVVDEQEMRSFAARCFRDGRPRLALNDLRYKLRGAAFTNIDQAMPKVPTAVRPELYLQDGFVATRLRVGSLVLVDGRRCATVRSLRDPLVAVEYDEPEEQPLKSKEDKAVHGLQHYGHEVPASSSSADEGEFLETLHKQRVQLRAVMPGVPKKHIPNLLSSQMHGLCILIDDCKRWLCPAARICGDVLSWRRYGVTSAIVIVLLCTSVASTIGFLMESKLLGLHESELARKLIK